MKKIKLTQGYETIVDDDDYHWLIKYKWYVLAPKDKRYNGRQYAFARTTIRKTMDDGFRWSRQENMHRMILGAMPGQIVDHINHNSLDNRKENLRICSPTESSQNCRKHISRSNKKCTSVFKGVSKNKKSGLWRAQIKDSGKTVYLGEFKIEKDAALAYNDAAAKYHGEFAVLNNTTLATDCDQHCNP